MHAHEHVYQHACAAWRRGAGLAHRLTGRLTATAETDPRARGEPSSAHSSGRGRLQLALLSQISTSSTAGQAPPKSISLMGCPRPPTQKGAHPWLDIVKLEIPLLVYALALYMLYYVSPFLQQLKKQSKLKLKKRKRKKQEPEVGHTVSFMIK